MSRDTEKKQLSIQDKPLVTLAIIAYKQQDLVHEAIEGAFAQTYSPLEIILSDDASPDDTFEVMKEMAANYTGPHAIRLNRNDTNLGVVGHVDRVTELANGELVIANAGDDVSVPIRTERIVDQWLDSGRNAHSIHSAYYPIIGSQIVERIGRPSPITRGNPTALEIAKENLNVQGCTQAWSKVLYSKFGPLGSNTKYEDGPLPFRAALIGEVRYIDEPLVYYREGGISTVSPKPDAMNILYGDKLNRARWYASAYEIFLADLLKVDHPDKVACIDVCKARLARLKFRIKLAESGKIQRFAELPGALWRRCWHNNKEDLHVAIRYALETIYKPAYNFWHFRRFNCTVESD